MKNILKFCSVVFLLISVGFIQAQDIKKYNRKDYPHWSSERCTSRDLVLYDFMLRKEFTGTPCDLESGNWLLVYSNELETNPTKIDIDHIIPLKYAHINGAGSWDKDTRRSFANDPENLVVSSRKENRSKGAKGPAEYMPPKNSCWYAKQWIYLAHKWSLKISAPDIEAIGNVLTGCYNKSGNE